MPGEAGADLIAHDGAFGTHLLQYDVCKTPLMFGAGGVLDPSDAWLGAPGFGTALRATAPVGLG